MTDLISSLESQLREKEQLVTALTERLEQAAEQLDRIRRSGGDRGLRVSGGGSVSAELIEEQHTLVAELQQAVQNWEQAQPGAALGRIESQLTEVRDLIAGLASGDGALLAPSWMPKALDDAPLADAPADEDADADADPGSGMSAYEAMKAQLMDSERGERRPPPKAPVPAAVIQPLTVTVEEIAPVDPPETIDVQTADIDELRQAVEKRDSYISYLTQHLRVAEMKYKDSIDWEVLNNAPEELRRRLEELEKTLHATLRHAEVDHSLERARLGREAMRLEQLNEQVRREMKRLNISDAADGDEDADGGREKPEIDRGANGRWQRLFGKK